VYACMSVCVLWCMCVMCVNMTNSTSICDDVGCGENKVQVCLSRGTCVCLRVRDVIRMRLKGLIHTEALIQTKTRKHSQNTKGTKKKKKQKQQILISAYRSVACMLVTSLPVLDPIILRTSNERQ
jgi:hypothetical protein